MVAGPCTCSSAREPAGLLRSKEPAGKRAITTFESYHIDQVPHPDVLMASRYNDRTSSSGTSTTLTLACMSFFLDLDHFHFLRPEWLWALLALPAAFFLSRGDSGSSRDWAAHVDPLLRPHVLTQHLARNLRWPLGLLAVFSMLAILALAGPVWQRLPAPVFRNLSPLVIVLDLSTRMGAQDLQPSRIDRARFKISDLLRSRKDGQTALLVYADDAFVVTPLTDDTQTIEAQLNALSPSIMPFQGERLSRALTQAVSLLLQAGQAHGDILVVTAGAVDDGTMEAVRTLRTMGYRVSVEGVGTSEGAPIPLPGGGFKKAAAGGLEMARLDIKQLWSIAQAGGGVYRTLDDDGNRDIDAILEFLQIKPEDTDNAGDAVEINKWREAGVFLLPVLVVLGAILFRRGWLVCLFVVLNLPLQAPPRADEGQGTWWRTPNQVGQHAFESGDFEQARDAFDDPDWKGASAFRMGDYESTLKTLEGSASASRDYNRGNALAMKGKYEEALKAYDAQLEKTPGDEDTVYNRKLVEDALKKQQQNQDKDKDKDKNKDQDKKSGQGDNKDPKQNDKNQDQGKDPSKDQGKNDANKDKQDGKDNPPPQNPPDQKPPKDSGGNKDENKDQGAPPEQKPGQKDGQPKDNPPPPPEGNDKEEPPAPEKPAASQGAEGKPPSDESDQSSAQWLRRIPDDPGGLLKRKFLYQSLQRQQQQKQKQ